MTDRLDFQSAGAVRPKPLWKMSDEELKAVAEGNDLRAERAAEELYERQFCRSAGGVS